MKLHYSASKRVIFHWVSAAVLLLGIAEATHASGSDEEVLAQPKCALSELKNALDADPKGLRKEQRKLTGQSSEGGIGIRYFKGRAVVRTEVQLFGETGRLEMAVASNKFVSIADIRWIDYQEPLPKLPVIESSVVRLRGYLCEGKLQFLGSPSEEIVASKADEFRSLVVNYETWIAAAVTDARSGRTKKIGKK